MFLCAASIPLYDALRALGAELRARGAPTRALIVGGANLVLRDVISRQTGDVDTLALLGADGDLICPQPLPDVLREAAREVSLTLGLDDPDWFNAQVAENWAACWPDRLPPGLDTDIEWLTYGALEIGLVGRLTLIPLKLHAVVDRARVRFGPRFQVTGADFGGDEAQKHLRDLLALAPSDDELRVAGTWVRDQDPSDHIPAVLDAVAEEVRNAR